jgi:hypothetical protein
MLHFIHYGKREHVEKFFEDGSIQIGTVRSYDTATHGPMIGDDDEGISRETVTDENIDAHLALGRPMPVDPFFGMPLFGAPGSYGNAFQTVNKSFNYAIFCMTTALHQQLCKNFDDSYDAAIFIDRPFPFLHELTKAFELSKLSNIHYRDRNLQVGEEIHEVFVKEPNYQHQLEVRAIWNIGDPKDKYYRFKTPKAVRCCRKILFDDMPSYEPGTISPEEFDKIMRKALSI